MLEIREKELRSQVSRRKSQQGAVLLVALVMLLVLTIVGTSGMGSVTLGEKMVSNMQNANKAFQGAEAALNECEDFLRTQNTVVLEQDTKTEDLNDLKTGTSKIIKFDASIMPTNWWDDEAFWTDYGIASTINSIKKDSDTPDGLNSEPRCFTAYIGNGTSTMDSDIYLYPGTNSPDAKLVYRITAYSQGADAKSEAVVESIFVKH